MTNDVDYLFVWLLDMFVYFLFSETILQGSLSTFNQVAFLLLSGRGSLDVINKYKSFFQRYMYF